MYIHSAAIDAKKRQSKEGQIARADQKRIIDNGIASHALGNEILRWRSG